MNFVLSTSILKLFATSKAKMKIYASHDLAEEIFEAKALWLHKLPLKDRMELLYELTDLILDNNPDIVKVGRLQSSTDRIRILSMPDDTT